MRSRGRLGRRRQGKAHLPGGTGDLIGGQPPVLGLPAVQELGQRFGPQPRRGRLGQPPRQAAAAA